jgi:nucleotide-binding universal stress UspA family protein
VFKKIIVPLDGSSVAELALPFAQEMAGRLPCALNLVYVKEEYERRSENIFHAYLDYMVQKIKVGVNPYLKESEVESLDIHWTILTGDPATEIVNYAEKTEGSQIIIAAHGTTGTDPRWPMGSVAEKVVIGTTRPVSVIRTTDVKSGGRGQSRMKKILVPLDGSQESEVFISYIKELADRINSSVTFLHIIKLDRLFTPPDSAIKRVTSRTGKYLEKLVKDFESSGIQAKAENLCNYDEVANTINKYSTENMMDLIIMVTRGFFSPRLSVLGSVTFNVLVEGSIPVMVLKTPAAADESNDAQTGQDNSA